MKALAMAAALSAVLAAYGFSAGQNPPPSTPSQRIRDLEQQLRSERDPERRRDLADRIEETRHRMGPRDERGNRNHPSAMWHDTILVALEGEVRRLEVRPKPTPTAAMSLAARLAVRRMAIACLERGWGWSDETRYRYDAFGMYLANNLGVLDALFDSVSLWAGREPPTEAGPDAGALRAAIASAQAALERLRAAAEHFAGPDPKKQREREALAADLPAIVEALGALDEAELAMRELGARVKMGDAGPAPGSSAPAPEPPTLTEEDRSRLEGVRQAAAALQGDAWQPIREDLVRFAALAEGALQVFRTRPQALELLDSLARAAEHARQLSASKSASPEYLESERANLAKALRMLSEKDRRQEGYSAIRKMWVNAADRRVLDASPLEAEACQGLCRASRLTRADFAEDQQGEDAFYAMRDGYRKVLRTLEQLEAWRAEPCLVRLAPLYAIFERAFLELAKQAGLSATRSQETLVAGLAAAGEVADDLERVLWGDRAAKAVAKYVPARGAPMAAEGARLATDLLRAGPNAQAPLRDQMDRYIGPFRALAEFQPPSADQARTASRLTGNLYGRAVAKFSQDATDAIESASRGDPKPLARTMEARWMFTLLWHRCLAEAEGWSAANPAALEAFSLPPDRWNEFLASMEKGFRTVLQEYLSTKVIDQMPETQFMRDWDTVYCAVLAAQRITLACRPAEESERARLLRNLRRVADPMPADETQFGWALAYYTMETAAALAGGFERTAARHLDEISERRRQGRFYAEFTSADLVPAAKAAPAPPSAPPTKGTPASGPGKAGG